MKIIIFGASGDLAKRKLFPALSKLELGDTKIIGFARTKYETPFKDVLKKFYTYDNDSFCDKIEYIQGRNYTDLQPLAKHLSDDTLVYLSLPPDIYLDVIQKLNEYSYRGIAIEKPFGESYESFLQFKKYPIEKLYFVDHFLLKHLVVSWPILVASSNDLASLLNTNHVKTVSVMFKEDIGAEGRAYFDAHGLVKDVVQSHITELAALAASDAKMKCTEQAEERLQILKNTVVSEEHSSFGQYGGYRHEMQKDSSTETFAVVTLLVNTSKWSNVPFVTISGKGLNEKKTEITYEFRRQSYQNVLDLIKASEHTNISASTIRNIKLVANLYPRNEVWIEIELCDKIQQHIIFNKEEVEKHMFEKYGNFENHEIVFNMFIANKPFSCVRYDEAEMLWNIFADIINKDKNIFTYPKGCTMPKEVASLLDKIEQDFQ